ncbi:MAG TPA: bifunctional biotin--[acetyl-CoA-carboxylase] ligase/biotin operon repressor BirA [Gammaproteobacteria bacterium]|nr:bifunctional biotin--[acetyl-CoA-carboxylase] ligase/biotin operon repressor BirA [Gammaproteobacteria bacterium]
MSLVQTVLKLLANGEFHSGSALGRVTGCSRSAVWKAIKALRDSGLEIYSVRGKGYRLSRPVEMLDMDKVRAALNTGSVQAIHCLEVFHDIDSTNTYLLERAKQGDNRVRACLAETQRTGRGRRGRNWVSPPGGNLYLSLSWCFDSGARGLSGLSLAAAVAVMRALAGMGLHQARLKWPNDILCEGRKLAGILLELAGEAEGPCAVVVGVGLNVRVPPGEMSSVEQPWTDLETALCATVSRNGLAARLLNELCHALASFEHQGLEPFLEEWAQWDGLAGQDVCLALPQGTVRGVVRGVDEHGALLLAHDGVLQRYHSGEVSVRLAADPRDPAQ